MDAAMAGATEAATARAGEQGRSVAERDFHLITGASGAGKTTLLAELARLGYATVAEAALAIVEEQRERGGNLLPWTDRAGFMRELLARNLRAHRAAATLPGPVFFDRGIGECLAWMRSMDIAVAPQDAAAALRKRYAPTVFVAEPWPQIYARTGERRAGFQRAMRSFETTVDAYRAQGYRLCVLPQVPVAERAAFVLERIAEAARPSPSHGALAPQSEEPR